MIILGYSNYVLETFYDKLDFFTDYYNSFTILLTHFIKKKTFKKLIQLSKYVVNSASNGFVCISQYNDYGKKTNYTKYCSN